MFTKRDYINWQTCRRIPKLEKALNYNEELDGFRKLMVEQGYDFEDLVKSTFPTLERIDIKCDIKSQVKKTRDFIEKGEGLLAEAVFADQHCMVRVDVLEVTASGLNLYEIKASSNVKEEHKTELAFQRTLIENLGYKILNFYVIHYDGKYELDKKLNLLSFIKQEHISLDTLDNYCSLSDYQNFTQDVMNNSLADVKVIADCLECPFKTHCIKDYHTATVFQLYNVNASTKVKNYNEGRKQLSDLNYKKLNLFNNNIINSKTNPVIIHKNLIKQHLAKLKYPIYYLDFETAIMTIPKYPKTKAKQQNLFQYSLHIKKSKNKITHKEYLIEPNHYDLDGLVKQLIKDLSSNGTIYVYNQKFESEILKDLKRMYPEYKDKIDLILDRMEDLMEVFQKGYYYNKDFGSSVSLKKVLTTLFPNDDSLDYSKLNQVHDGMEATHAWLNLENKSKTAINKTINNLKKYCQLDTYAMVKIHEYLENLVN